MFIRILIYFLTFIKTLKCLCCLVNIIKHLHFYYHYSVFSVAVSIFHISNQNFPLPNHFCTCSALFTTDFFFLLLIIFINILPYYTILVSYFLFLINELYKIMFGLMPKIVYFCRYVADC